MYLLDTNICIAITKGHQSVLKVFGQRRKICALPIIVVAELYKGAHCSTKIASNIEIVNGFLRVLPTVEFNRDAAEDFGRIQAHLRKIWRLTGDVDALIAAIARSHSATLVTHNTKDFENIPGLELEDWLV